MTIKISKFVKVTGVINQVFKPSQVQRHARLRVYRHLLDQYLPMAARHGPSGRQSDNSRDEIYETDCRMLAA
jgi:hypothetical protein